jgi:hypothetical protein
MKLLKIPKVPKGWYRIRKGTAIKKGDKFIPSGGKRWLLTGAYCGMLVGWDYGYGSTLHYIRRKQTKGK